MFPITDYFKKRPKILVFVITFLIYSPLLFNHFVGDDITFTAGNAFYSSWKNIPRLIEKGYIANSQEISYGRLSSDIGSGSYSYRPIGNLTFFLDHCFFRSNPYGSHLINILIHCINSVLVYWIVNQIFSSSTLGIFAGLFFSLHPIQSEAVANVSCRFDLLAAMFVLCSFYFWIKFKQGEYVRKEYYAGSLAMCFLALFSKESALMLPFVIVLFDQILINPRAGLKHRGIYYIGFIPILILYLYLYTVVFPNSVIYRHWLGGSFINHCFVMGCIWYSYLINVLFPWTVKLIPSNYYPSVPGTVSLATAEIGMAFIILITSVFMLWRNFKEGAFFLLWYAIFYLPVSNLIPLFNPMACRFMYLPSIGILIVLAFFLHKVFKMVSLKEHSPFLSNILHGAVIIICVTRTLFLNGDWKNNFNVGWAYVRDYPAYYQGYIVLGLEYFKAGNLPEAKEYFEKSVLLGGLKPIDTELAMCYIQLGEIREAEALLKRIISYYPDYDPAYLLLGEIYSDQGQYSQAKEMLEKSLILNPKEPREYMLLERRQSGEMLRP